jgi:hypothetical protein
MKTHLIAERVLDAPAEVVYHLIADEMERLERHARAHVSPVSGPEGWR